MPGFKPLGKELSIKKEGTLSGSLRRKMAYQANSTELRS